MVSLKIKHIAENTRPALRDLVEHLISSESPRKSAGGVLCRGRPIPAAA